MTEGPQHRPAYMRPLWLRLVLGRPAVWAILLAVATFAALAAAVLALRIEADVAKVIRGDTPAYADYLRLEGEFGQPSRDEILVVHADDFGQPETYLALENLVLELQLAPSVGDVLGIFTLPDPEGLASTLLARNDLRALAPAERLKRLTDTAPLARFFLSEDRRTTVLVVLPILDIAVEERLADLHAAIARTDPSLVVTVHGVAALNREIGTTLLADQAVLIPVGVLVCLLCAMMLFSSWRAALICGVVPVLSLIWTFGVLAATGSPFTPFMATVPVVLIVLGVADSVHVYHAILRILPSHPLEDAIPIALQELLPAIALTTGTTALAFLSLLLVGSPTLAEVGAVGAMGLMLTFVAVFLAMPLAVRLLSQSNFAPKEHIWVARLARLTVRALPARSGLRLAALLVLSALIIAQVWGVRGFDLMDHIPYGSPVRSALAELERDMPGSGYFFVVVDGADDVAEASADDRARLRDVAAAIYGSEKAVAFTEDTYTIGGAVGRRFMGEHRLDFALPVPTQLSTNSQATLANAAELEAKLDRAGLAEVTRVTGYSRMVNTEMPQQVSEMRRAFYIAVFAVTLLIWLLYRSIFFALVSLVPNLIPILGVEAVLALVGEPLTLTAAISLTIAFGIAVDDTIHLINRTRLIQSETGAPMPDCVARALSQIVPPVFATSVILTLGFMVSAFSSLPSIAIFGGLAAGATVIALAADLALFPSLLLWRWDWRRH